ncbi:LexA repressor [bioreactor metagenome]|uniref:LexA repressor n=1 Tax=bioreactor metagenome TaxID=1076179 RepID=A0A645E8E2_9ZZZZ
MGIGEKIKKAREAAGLTQDDLANLCSFSRTSIVNWETGKRSIQLKNLELIAKALNVPVSDLAVDEGKVPFVTQSSNDIGQHKGGRILGPESLTWVPVISPIVKVSAGTGNLCTDVEWERIDDFPLFDGEIAALYSNNGLLSMYVEGDSMEPQVHDGDLVVFKKTTEWVSGNVMVVCLDGRLLVKGVVRGPKGDTILRSTNKNYRDIEIGEESFFLVYGRVLRIIRHWEPKSVL